MEEEYKARVRALEDRERQRAVTLICSIADRATKLPPASGAGDVAIVLKAIEMTAYRRLDALLALLNVECDREVGILARTFIELVISATYIATRPDPDEAAARFRAFTDSQHGTLLEWRRDRLGDEGAREDVPRFDDYEDLATKARARFPDLQKTAVRGWSGIGIAEMVRALPEPLKSFAEPLYKRTFWLLSEFAHVTWKGTHGALCDRDPISVGLIRESLGVIGDSMQLLFVLARTEDSAPLDIADLLHAYETTREPWPSRD